MSLLFATGLLFVSIFVAWAGGNLFIRGVHAVGQLFRLSGVVAGLLIASISTSSPELFVGVSSALRGIPEVSLGDVLGSNIVNIALIFGIFLILSPRRPAREDIRIFDVVSAISAPFLIILCGADGELSQIDGLILLSVFALWVRMLTSGNVAGTPERNSSGNMLHFATGLAMLVVAGYAFTESAGVLAKHFAVDLFLLSSIIVALGTSMPELATTIVAVRRNEGALAIGNLLGSNIFNSLAILGIVAIIHPFAVDPMIISIPIAIAAVATGATLLSRILSARATGILLIALYVLFVIVSATFLH